MGYSDQLALNAEWDADLLRIELTDLEALDIDLGSLGFSEEELSKFISEVTDGATDPDSIPAPPDEAITQRGDLWILGNHRLLCGDNGNAADVDRLLDAAVVDLINADCPYNVKVEPRSNNAILPITHLVTYRIVEAPQHNEDGVCAPS